MPKLKQTTVARDIIDTARRHRARFKGGRVRLKTLERKKMSWLSASMLLKMGVPPKPAANSICQRCGRVAASFQLDHMGPWRQHVAALAGPHMKSDGKIKICYVRALYNDPANLWWVCATCNGRKSDYISEDGSFPTTGVRGRDVDIDSFM
ncbi:MAG: hypothetical protein ACT4PZ_05880 [Panacagrimonas sp.]